MAMRSGDPSPAQRVKSAVAVLVSLIVLVGGLGFVGAKVYGAYQDYTQRDDYVGDGADTVEVVIPKDSTWQRAGDILEARGVIASAATFVDKVTAAQSAAGSADKVVLQAGKFKMKTRWPAQTALDYLLDPAHIELVKVTLLEGWRWADQIRPALLKATELTSADFDQALADPAGLGLPAYANNQVEGFLFPDTYQMPEGAGDILRQLISNFNDKAAGLDLANKAAALGRSPRDVVIVASIIESEVNKADDMPKVARAIYNRLDQGMPLGVESAFRYGRLMASGTAYSDPIDAAAQQDSSLPYNVYTNPGLPATPVSNPGQAALRAALSPAEGDWLYWVTVDLDTGETKFTSDEAEFEDFRAQFQAWCADHGNPTGCQ